MYDFVEGHNLRCDKTAALSVGSMAGTGVVPEVAVAGPDCDGFSDSIPQAF